jgi:TatD DNase family protein
MHYYDIHTHRLPTNPDITAIVSVEAGSTDLSDYAYCSVGIHPRHTNMTGLSDLEATAKHPNVVAIGETGLDKLASIPMEQQEKLFKTHIELAGKLRKPLIIHCVKAWPALIRIRKQMDSDSENVKFNELAFTGLLHSVRNDEVCQPSLRGTKQSRHIPWIIHGFRGNGELARQLLQFGFYLSFGIHFHPDALRIAWESHRLYAETDDLNISIVEVYQRITAQLTITAEALSHEIHENLQSWPSHILSV